MKKLILDYSKWRCGGEIRTIFGSENYNKLGEGKTQLRNEEGYMCCLGQFSLQVDPTLKEEDITGKGEPLELKKDISYLTERVNDEEWDGYEYAPKLIDNTYLSTEAMDINDNAKTTPQEKIEKLKKLFWEEAEITIEVINQPNS